MFRAQRPKRSWCEPSRGSPAPPGRSSPAARPGRERSPPPRAARGAAGDAGPQSTAGSWVCCALRSSRLRRGDACRCARGRGGTARPCGSPSRELRPSLPHPLLRRVRRMRPPLGCVRPARSYGEERGKPPSIACNWAEALGVGGKALAAPAAAFVLPLGAVGAQRTPGSPPFPPRSRRRPWCRRCLARRREGLRRVQCPCKKATQGN